MTISSSCFLVATVFICFCQQFTSVNAECLANGKTYQIFDRHCVNSSTIETCMEKGAWMDDKCPAGSKCLELQFSTLCRAINSRKNEKNVLHIKVANLTG
jgi:hypothetical protein